MKKKNPQNKYKFENFFFIIMKGRTGELRSLGNGVHHCISVKMERTSTPLQVKCEERGRLIDSVVQNR